MSWKILEIQSFFCLKLCLEEKKVKYICIFLIYKILLILIPQKQALSQEQDDSLNQSSMLNQSPEIDYNIKKSQVRRNPITSSIIKNFLATVLLVVVFLLTLYHFGNISKDHNDLNRSGLSKKSLPKIFWIYTRGEVMAQHAENLIYFYHLRETAERLGYEVRVVNSWTAYQWLKNQTKVDDISKTIHKTRIDQTVDNLLKLALLIQHGGIMPKLNLIINKDLKLIQEMFDKDLDQKSPYYCSKSEVFMPEFKQKEFGIKFFEDFIVARPQSLLLKDTFEVLKQTILTGNFPENQKLQVMKHNDGTNVDFIPNAIQNCVSYLIYQYLKTNPKDHQGLCKKYGMQRVIDDITFNLRDLDDSQSVDFMFKRSSRSNDSIILNVNTNPVNEAVGRLIFNPISTKNLDNQSIIYSVLQAKGNREIFLDPPPSRKNLEMCVIVIDDLEESQVFEMYNTLSKQSYSNWTLTVFLKKKANINISDKRLTTLVSEGNEIRNIEVAVTQICSQKGYAILLHEGDSFKNSISLQLIAEAFEPKWLLGGAINLQIDGLIHNATQEYLSYSRSADGIVNPKIEKMEGIVNHFRIFSVEAFRYLPQFDFTNIYGQYFKDRIIFVGALLEMIYQPIKTIEQEYLFLRYYEKFNIPRKAILIDPCIHIKTRYFDSIDRYQIEKTKARFDVQQISRTFQQVKNFDIPFDKLIVFNPGNKWVSVDDKKGPDLIPKVIHQIWIGGKMGVAQEYFLKKTKTVYPNYEVKLWGETDITPQNFPFSYDMIMNLLDFHRNRKTVWHKLATVTDIMRHEILYNQGGFWKDSGMNLLRPIFDKFVKYQLVIGAERSLRHRWNQGMCFFANAPKSKHLERIAGLPNINRMRIYVWNALEIAGPFDFRNVVIGYEEYSPSVLMMNLEYFYPGQMGRPPFNDLCTRYEQEYKGEPAHFQHNGCYLLQGCQNFYPEAFGLDHNCFGVSWMKKFNS